MANIYDYRLALAQVLMWGRIAVHENGYRAENVSIEQLWIGNKKRAKVLQERYGIPVGSLKDAKCL